MSKIDAQKYFEKFLSLVGKEVELGLRSTGKTICGIVTNAMFDSFLFRSDSGIKCISFDDVAFVTSK